MTHNCRVCDVKLTDDNWYPSQKCKSNICKECARKKSMMWRINNPEKVKAKNLKHNTINNRKHGHLSMEDNKECTVYLGVHINERLLRHYFNDVEVMPYGFPGYDFVCNNGWKIDAKSSATGDKGHWTFHFNHNTTAEYFFCVAYDNRTDLNIIHIWILPGDKFGHLTGATISKSTIDKWSEYEQPIDKISTCCNKMHDKHKFTVQMTRSDHTTMHANLRAQGAC